MDTLAVTVEEIDPTSAHFGALVRLLEDADRELVGDDAVPEPPGYLAASWRTPRAIRRGWVALEDGRAVGGAMAQLALEDNTHLVDVELAVEPGSRRRGYGRSLLATVLDAARADGRDTALLYTGYRPGVAEVWRMHERAVLDPSLTFSFDPGPSPGVHLVRSIGASLVQTELRSQVRLPVPAATVEALAAEAREHSRGYRTVTWTDGVGEKLLQDRAELASRMSTDPPLGGMDYRAETWDPTRIRQLYADLARRGLTVLGAGAVEEATGRMVAFSEVHVHAGLPQHAWQGDTIVLAEHRGHRLGVLVKAANLELLQASRPTVRTVETWNALENGPMLRVNRAMAFVPVALYAVWQLRING